MILRFFEGYNFTIYGMFQIVKDFHNLCSYPWKKYTDRKSIAMKWLWNLLARQGFESLDNGGSGGIRTHDQRIKSPLLYRLSYRPRRNKTWNYPLLSLIGQ